MTSIVAAAFVPKITIATGPTTFPLPMMVATSTTSFASASPVTHVYDGNCNDLMLTTAAPGPNNTTLPAVNTLVYAPSMQLNVSMRVAPGSVLAYFLATLGDTSTTAVLATTSTSAGTFTTANAVYIVNSLTVTDTGGNATIVNNNSDTAAAAINDVPCATILASLATQTTAVATQTAATAAANASAGAATAAAVMAAVVAVVFGVLWATKKPT